MRACVPGHLLLADDLLDAWTTFSCRPDPADPLAHSPSSLALSLTHTRARPSPPLTTTALFGRSPTNHQAHRLRLTACYLSVELRIAGRPTALPSTRLLHARQMRIPPPQRLHQAFAELADRSIRSVVSFCVEPPSSPRRLLAVDVTPLKTEPRRCTSSSPATFR